MPGLGPGMRSETLLKLCSLPWKRNRLPRGFGASAVGSKALGRETGLFKTGALPPPARSAAFPPLVI